MLMADIIIGMLMADTIIIIVIFITLYLTKTTAILYCSSHIKSYSQLIRVCRVVQWRGYRG